MKTSRVRVRTIILTTAAVAAAFLAVLVSSLGRSPTFDPIAVLGKPAPTDQMTLLGGDTLRLPDLRGKAVLVNFWNSWCEPCQQEAPALDLFYADHANDADFEMVGIVHDDTESEARRWVEARDIPWPIALDPHSEVALNFGTTGQPETYAIAPDGTIVAKRAGPATTDDLARLLAMARGQA